MSSSANSDAAEENAEEPPIRAGWRARLLGRLAYHHRPSRIFCPVLDVWVVLFVDRNHIEIDNEASRQSDALIDAAMKSFPVSGGTIDRVHLVPVR
jgi:hypothetical protein